MQHLRCILPVQKSYGVATRLTEQGTQTLMSTIKGLASMCGSNAYKGLEIGP